MMKNFDVKDDFRSPDMEKVKKRLSILKMTPAEQIDDESYIKDLIQFETALKKAKAEERLKIIQSMLKEQFSHEIISEISGESLEEIQKISKKNRLNTLECFEK